MGNRNERRTASSMNLVPPVYFSAGISMFGVYWKEGDGSVQVVTAAKQRRNS